MLFSVSLAGSVSFLASSLQETKAKTKNIQAAKNLFFMILNVLLFYAKIFFFCHKKIFFLIIFIIQLKII
jgi:hypothetical protein